MAQPLITIFGKAVRSVTRLRGGGTALPGLFVERIDPQFIKRTLAPLTHGVVVISGTNGKTTTTKMVVELLESQGLKVFTNRTGSNFTRGVAAALLGEVDMKGVLHADIAVLELDEAHAVHFVKTIPPKFSLILNVMRDQLDRFGEIDATNKLLQTIAKATTDTVVLNREDERVASISEQLDGRSVRYFGLDKKLLTMFPSDDTLHGGTQKTSTKPADVVLEKLEKDSATFRVGTSKIETSLKVNGAYNVFNAAAAIALVRAVLDDHVRMNSLTDALSKVEPAFGRGETIMIHGQPVELVLVKNPSGFRLGLSSFDASGYATMIAINDNYADGRDMSWLWDVDFSSLAREGVSLTTGIRAFDMALRLQYDEVPLSDVVPSIPKALRRFLGDNKKSPKRIYCTYTAMLEIRRLLSKQTNVRSIG